MKRTALLSLLVVAVPATAAIAPPPGVAPALRASAAEEPAFMLSGNGVHIFQCRPVGADGRFGWVFIAPDATLYEGSRSAATHKAANLIESLSDRSSVAATVRSTQSAGGNNLPWALMGAEPIGASGLFAGVTSVQRVNTSGGCGPANEGAESRVAFRAEYYFYKLRGAG